MTLARDTAFSQLKQFAGLVRPPDNVGTSCRQHHGHGWECRDCGEDGAFQEWEQCPLPSQRGGCDFQTAVKASDEDSKTVVSSLYVFERAERNRLRHFGYPPYFEQMPCNMISDCVSLQKCKDGLTVYAYNESLAGHDKAKLASAVEHLRFVTEPSQACLLLVSCEGTLWNTSWNNAPWKLADSNPPENLTTNVEWNGGKNHLIWQAHRCWPGQNHPDMPFPQSWNYGMASIASAALMHTNLRRMYDISLPLFTNPVFGVAKTELLKPLPSSSRPLLLVLKCNMYDWEQVWWQYRWLAYKYWKKTSDVIMDVTCPEKGKRFYDEDYPYNYTQLLLNSKFAFTPGGGSVSSYRFAEALALGSIPVLTPDLPDPLDLDWSRCVIRVSVSRIVDLPRLLRNISEEEIASRQVQCKRLFDRTIGWKELINADYVSFDMQQLFIATIEVWWARVQDALRDSESRKQWQRDIMLKGTERKF